MLVKTKGNNMQNKQDMNKDKEIKEIKDDVIIDRKEENKLVMEYKRTGDLDILSKIYEKRIPTLRTWVRQHYYPGLSISREDFFEELTVIFMHSIEKYDIKRADFNTCLFNFLLNRIKNIKNRMHAKKRIPENYNGPLSSMVLSLDYSYNDQEGSEVTLKDVVSENMYHEEDDVLDKMHLNDIISSLSKGDDTLKEFFSGLSEGKNVTELMKEYKTKKGVIRIDSVHVKKLKNKKCKKTVSKILKEKNKFESDFDIIDFDLKGKSSLAYTVELNKTPETDFIMKSMREMRKNKDYYLESIK
jgi:hypothetical protein